MRTERLEFPNAKGEKLSALLDLPLGKPAAFALFAHCFTCGKDNLAAKRIAERLAMCGIGVLRFDFTGLGTSEGNFADTHFSSNVDDLVAAADFLRTKHGAPAILIGHSLGGAAVLAAAHRVADARAVVTIAAPCDPAHVTGLFKEQVDKIREQGEVEVSLAGRPFRIKREFLDDISEQRITERVAALRKALLIFHSPTDDTVSIDNASRIFAAAKHPKSFVSLAGADHLLGKKSDAVYVANVIAAWAERYLEQPIERSDAQIEVGTVLVRETGNGKFQQEILSGPHRFLADEPVKVGGLELRARSLRSPARGARRLHLDDAAALCRWQEVAAQARVRAADPQQDPRRGLSQLRDQGRHGRPDRSQHHVRRRARCRATQAAAGDCRQVPGAPDTEIGNRDQDVRAARLNDLVERLA